MNIDNELVSPMGADHSSLCKFPNATNPRYELVKHALEELVAYGLNGTQSLYCNHHCSHLCPPPS